MATDEETAASGGTPSNDDIYDVLADRRRRYAIHYLKQRREAITVRELAEQVAAWENDKPPEALTSQERKRVYIALYQSHLASMDADGVVEYDADAGTVRLADAFGKLDVYLEVVPRRDVPWSLYYLGLAVANLIVIVLAWLEVTPFSIVPDMGWAVVVLVTFAVSAFVQTYSARRMRIGDEGPPPDLSGP